MAKKVLITGAGSGFGKGASLALAKKGYEVIASVEIAPHKTSLLEEAKKENVELQVEVLNITIEEDRQAIFRNEIDVLVNNAAIMETGPIAEIPMELVRRNFETNFFATLEMTQGFVPQMVKRGSGKIIFISSMGGLVSFPFVSVYTATKHALESVAEGLKSELAGTGVEICTINPGAYATGFNDRGGETMNKWFDPAKSYTKPEVFEMLSGGLNQQGDPQEVFDMIVKVVEEDNSKFRNVVPEELGEWIKGVQEQTWKAKKDDPLMSEFPG